MREGRCLIVYVGIKLRMTWNFNKNVEILYGKLKIS